MKVVLAVDTKPEDWFKLTHDSDDVSGHLDNLSAKAILATQDSSWAEKSNISFLDLRSKLIRESVIRKACIARVKETKSCDLAISDGKFLHQLLQSVEFNECYETYSADLVDGENREEFFERKVGHLLPFVEKFEFLDPFFSRNVIHQKTGAFYVLQRCLDAGVPEIMFHSFEEGQDVDALERHLDQIERKISALYSQKPRRSLLKIRIYGGTKSHFPHDRFGELKFSHRSLGFSIGQGAEVFSANSSRPAAVFEPIQRSFKSLAAHLDSLEMVEEFIFESPTSHSVTLVN